MAAQSKDPEDLKHAVPIDQFVEEVTYNVNAR